MYQPLLTRKYLTTKVMPLLAAVGVTLCVCMVLVVWSVMGGFLNMLLANGKQLTGDVAITRSGDGIPYYAQLVQRLEARPEVAAATATIETVGLVNFPGFNASPQYVQVIGIDPDGYHRVTGFVDQLYWKPLDEPLPTDDDLADPRLDVAGLEQLDPPIDTLLTAAAAAGVTPETIDQARERWSTALQRAENAATPAEGRRLLVDALWDVRDAVQRGLPERFGADADDDTPPAELALQNAWRDAVQAHESAMLRGAIVDQLPNLAQRGRQLQAPNRRTGQPGPAALLGLEVSGAYQRSDAGFVTPRGLSFFMPANEVVVSVVALSGRGAAQETADRRMPVANEFRSGMFEVDSRWVLMPRHTLQQMLGLDEKPLIDPNWRPGRVVVDPDTGEARPEEPPVVGTEPARATGVLVRAADGVTERDLLPIVQNVYDEFAAEQPGALPRDFLRIFTWDERPGLKTFIAAVRKETALVLFLFSLISLTAVVLILAIFWSMISEKTKDIGILRSVGASRLGVTWLFLRYGLAIGLVGSVIGVALALAIVININAIHSKLQQWLGVTIWDPSVYYFFRIPNEVQTDKLLIVFVGGVLASALGALIPALRAASLDPVKALRFE